MIVEAQGTLTDPGRRFVPQSPTSRTPRKQSFVFLSTMSISESSGGVTLTSSHDSRPQGIAARLKPIPMPPFKGMVRKALLQDLNDTKAAVEQK